jgi:DNA polymerase-3 subunit delta'
MKDNWGILGHTWAVNLLQSHLRQDRLRHAYLFTGPQGVGRRTLALRFTQALYSPDHGYTPESRLSQQVADMKHPDLSVVSRLEGDRDIKIEAIRELQHILALSPYMAPYRVALLLNFEEANANAANALLKTLEEPPGRVILLVTAESTESLLPTIVSRCEVLRLRPMSISELSLGLVDGWGIKPEQAKFLAHSSGGKPGYALHLLKNPDILEQRQEWLEDLQTLTTANRVARFAYAEKKSKDKERLIQLMLVWLSYWRDVLLIISGSRAPLTNQDRAEEIKSLASQLDLEATRDVVVVLEEKLGEMRANVNVRLATEALMLNIPHL